MPYVGMGQIHEIRAPSGQKVSISPEEEAEIVKSAIEAKIMDNLTWPSEAKKAAIGAVGNAVGFALGGLLVGWLLGKKAGS